MNRSTFLKAVSELADDIVAKAGSIRAEFFENTSEPQVLKNLKSQEKEKKKSLRAKKNIKMFVILAACLAVLIPLGIFVTKLATGSNADVRLESLSGGAIDGNPYESAPGEYIKVPGGFSLLSAAGNNDNLFTFIDKNEDADEKKNKNNGVSTGKITAAPQTVIMFDTSEYATIEISLDNPYEYYICDFYLICSEPGAQVYVDNQWFPLDGSVKVRWTGATNRYASYTVYIPSVEQGASIKIEDMRYLNNTEIAVDMKKHNVADVYHMEAPLYTQFIVNTMEKYVFRIITSENCTGFDIEGADPSSFDPKYSDLYEVTKDGTVYQINYTFRVPGTNIEGHGEIISEQISLLRIINHIDYGRRTPIYFNNYFVREELDAIYKSGVIFGLNFSGNGITFHSANKNDAVESDALFKEAYFCDQGFTVSINGGAAVPAVYVQMVGNGISRMGYLFFNCNLADSAAKTLEVYWNGYLIYSVEPLYNYVEQ